MTSGTIKRRAGFTLLEILLVMAVSALIFATVAPILMDSEESRALDDITSQVATLAQDARRQARETDVVHEIRFERNRLELVALSGEDTILETINYPSSVKFELNDGGSTSSTPWRFLPGRTNFATRILVRCGALSTELRFDPLTAYPVNEP